MYIYIWLKNLPNTLLEVTDVYVSIYIYIYIFSSPGSSAAAQRCMFGWPFWMLRGPDFGPVDEPSVRRFAWEPSCQNYMQPHLCAVAPDPN